jgi:hypothetical protein
MKIRFCAIALAFAALFAARAASAENTYKADPDWPCAQIKTPAFPLASVWDGPTLDLDSQAWREDRDLSDLVAKMAARRTSIADAEAAIAAFAKTGPEARKKLPLAFAAAFQSLSDQRSQIIAGLERFGRRQREMAESIRAESAAAQGPASANAAPSQDPAAEKLNWDIRIFEERHRAASYACETTELIEQRIGALARAVQAAL